MASTPFERCEDSFPERFVILHHTGYGREHWDLMFEQPEVLVTWKVYHEPRELSKTPLQVFRIPDHRKRYLDYEGPVSGGRGDVKRVCAGTFDLLKKTDDFWQVRIDAEAIAGEYELLHQQSDCWLMRPRV